MSAILKFDLKKKEKREKRITFFRRRLSKLHKKDRILHVKITFSTLQGETRNGSGSITVITVPLNICCTLQSL